MSGTAISSGEFPGPALPADFDPRIDGLAGAVGAVRQSAGWTKAWIKTGPRATDWQPFPFATPAFQTDAIDLTATGTTLLVPQQAGKLWLTTRLDVEIVASDITGTTAPDFTHVGANSPNFDNLTVGSLHGNQAGKVLHLGAFATVDVGSHGLVVNVAQAQAGGVLSVRFRIYGGYQ